MSISGMHKCLENIRYLLELIENSYRCSYIMLTLVIAITFYYCIQMSLFIFYSAILIVLLIACS